MFRLITDIKELFSHKEIFLNLFICIVWGNYLLGALRGVVNHLPVLCDVTDEIEIACVIIPLVLALPAIINRLTLLDYTIFFSLVLSYGIDYIIHPYNTEILNEHAFDTLCIVFPMYFVGRFIDIKRHYNIFCVISALCIVWTLFYYLSYAQQHKVIEEVAGDDNMYTAYAVLPHIIMLSWAYLKKFNIVYFVLTFLGILFLLSCGTRGPFAGVIFFYLCYFFLFMNFKYAYILKCTIISLGMIVISFLHDIIFYLAYTFANLKLSTRILEKFVDGEIGNDSGRGAIVKSLLHITDTKGNFFGLGYFGVERFYYNYSHNFFADHIIYFGYILGPILLLAIFTLIATAIYKAKDKTERCFLICILSFTLLKLFLSSTIIKEPFYYMLIGYCVSIAIFNVRKENSSK